MPTLLKAILYLKAVLDNESIFCKMDSYSKKRKKKKSVSLGKKGKSVENILFRFVFQNSSSPNNAYLSKYLKRTNRRERIKAA